MPDEAKAPRSVRRQTRGGVRVVLRIARVTCACMLVACLAAMGFLVALDTPPGRRLVVREVNGVLASSFKGRVTVRRLGHVDPWGVSGLDATIDDPAGRQVASLRNVRVGVATMAALRSALFHKKEALTIRLTVVGLESADVVVDADPAGQLELVDAFAPAGPKGPPDPNGRPLRLIVEQIALGQARAQGRFPGAPPLDVRLDDLRASLTYAPDALDAHLDGARVMLKGVVGDADVTGALGARLHMAIGGGALPEGSATWNGTVGRVAHSMRASFDGHHLDAVFDVPDASPQDIRTVWAKAPIDRPSRLHAEAHGPLGDVDLALHVQLGEAGFDAGGRASLEGPRSARIGLSAHDVDIHEAATAVPSSRLGLSGEIIAVEHPDGTLEGGATLRLLGGRLGEGDAPPASIRARMSRRDRDLTATADVIVDDPSTRLHLRFVSTTASQRLSFQAESNVDDIRKLPGLGRAPSGHASLSVAGHVDLTRGTVEAHARARARQLQQGSNRLEELSIDATAAGSLAAPKIDASARSRGLLVGGLHLASADAVVDGFALRPHIAVVVRGEDVPDIDAVADVGLKPPLSVSGLRIDLSRAEERAHVEARSVKVQDGAVSVDDVRVDGLGSPLSLALRRTPREFFVRASTAGIDLGRIGRLAHLGDRLRNGTVAVDADVTLRPGQGTGHLVVDAAHVDAVGAKAVSARANLALDGRSIRGTLHADVPDVGVLDVSVPKVTLGGVSPWIPATWERAFGSVDAEARADLSRLSALVPAEDLPVGEARGNVQLEVHLARDDVHDMTPDVTVRLETQGLVLSPRVPLQRDIDGVLVYPAPSWRLADVDLDLNGSLDGKTGALRLATTTHDRRGEMAALDVSSRHVPCTALFGDPSRWLADLQKADVDATLTVPERGLGTLPKLLEQHYVTGRVHAKVTLSGTLAAPRVDVVAGVRHAGLGAASATARPMDVDVEAHYDGKVATGSAKARSNGQDLLNVEARLDGAPPRLFASGGADLPWKASARVHATAFPLDAIAALDNKLVSGAISGDVSIDGLHQDARLDAGLSVDPLSVGSIAYKSAKIAVRADSDAIDADLRIDQADGFGEAKAHAAAVWGARLAPALGPSQPLDASIEANNLRIAAFQPFVAGVLDELDGRLDTRLKVELDPRDRATRLSGDLTLTRGAVEAAVGGGELHDITADVRFDPSGAITLEKLDATGISGKLHAQGIARIEGTSLRSARATVTIPGNAAIPLTVGGVELGDVDGRIDVDVAPQKDGRAPAIRVDVPKLDVKLSESSALSPEPLGPFPDNVRVGVHRDDPSRFVLVPLDPSVESQASRGASATAATLVTAHLGEVHVSRGTQLGVDVAGDVKVDAGATVRATGQIRLKKGGKLDVEGRTFVVESGTVTFVDDPANPEVVVKAGWKAPDGTVVFATFTGPLKTGKVTLTSEPRLSKEEIVQVLLFGSAGGKQAQTPASSTENSALATAGGEAAQPLNHMLNQLGLGAFTAKVDTSESANPKPEVEVQIAKDISLQIAVVLGQPPPGVNPDRTLVTLDWRMFSKWSLATTVGDAGTTIFDLLWERRY